MARFSLKKNIRLIVKGAGQSVIPNPEGIPTVVNSPAVMIELKAGVVDITDPVVIERIRRDQKYNTPEGIIEISEEEIEVEHIKTEALKAADEKIKERKKNRSK